MSKSLGPKVEMHCSYDCELGGCPGHTVQEQFDRSTDVYTFLVDDVQRYHFDEAMLAALLKAHSGGGDE